MSNVADHSLAECMRVATETKLSLSTETFIYFDIIGGLKMIWPVHISTLLILFAKWSTSGQTQSFMHWDLLKVEASRRKRLDGHSILTCTFPDFSNKTVNQHRINGKYSIFDVRKWVDLNTGGKHAWRRKLWLIGGDVEITQRISIVSHQSWSGQSQSVVYGSVNPITNFISSE